MSKSRRQFLGKASIGIMATATACRQAAREDWRAACRSTARIRHFTRSRARRCLASTFAEAEKLVQVELQPADREVAAGSWRRTLASVYERRTGPRKFTMDTAIAPATRWDPVLPGQKSGPDKDRFVRTQERSRPSARKRRGDRLRAVDQALALDRERASSLRSACTNLYLDRLARFDPKLRCVITLTRDHALEQAKQADQEIAAGKYRGPLHGIPWGAKDLVDTAGIPTTYGAEPFRNRVPTQDSAVVKRLNDAGAVLVAKLSLGAMALNDIWFGGQTMNPWLLEEGASGIERRAGRRHGRRPGGLLHRQRDRRQHRQPFDAMWPHRTAPHLRARAAHRRDDAVLVAR